MQRVEDIYEELGVPGQQKLWLEVKKRKRQAVRQVFTNPLARSEGKTASEDVSARYMLDIVNFRTDVMALFLVNVFTRKVWAVVITDKSAASVLKAGKALIEGWMRNPKL